MNMKNIEKPSIIWQDPCICQIKKTFTWFPVMSSRLVLETNLMMVGKACLSVSGNPHDISLNSLVPPKSV